MCAAVVHLVLRGFPGWSTSHLGRLHVWSPCRQIIETLQPDYGYLRLWLLLVSRCSNSRQIWCGVYRFTLASAGYADGEDWPAATLEECPGGGRRRPRDGQNMLQCSRADQWRCMLSPTHTHTHTHTHINCSSQTLSSQAQTHLLYRNTIKQQTVHRCTQSFMYTHTHTLFVFLDKQGRVCLNQPASAWLAEMHTPPTWLCILNST